MTIDYQVTADDVMAFRLFLGQKSPQVYKIHTQVRQILFVLGLIGFLIAILGFRSKFILNFIGPMSLMIILYALIYPLMVRLFVLSTAKKLFKYGFFDKAIGHHQITLHPDNLIIKSSGRETKLLWQGIEFIHSTENNIYLFTNMIEAYIIPKNNYHAWNEFLRILQAYYINRAIVVNN